MSERSARRWLFLAIALMVPFPSVGPFGGFVPAVRHGILLAVTSAVAVVEGAAGPVPGILVLFAVHLVVTLLLAWLMAWGLSRAMAPLSPGARRVLVSVLCIAMLAVALSFEIYETPFGRAPTANWLGVLS